MAPVVPPDDSMAVLIKSAFPVLFTLLIALLKRRKTLLKWMRESVHILAEEDKRATDERQAVAAETNGAKEHYLEMNLEQFLERFKDTGEDIRDAHRAVDKERRERLSDMMMANAELAKLSVRIEKYHQEAHDYSDGNLAAAKAYTDSQVADLKTHIDGQLKALSTTMRQNHEDTIRALRELKDAA